MPSSREALKEHQDRLKVLEGDLCADGPRISAYHDLPFAIFRYAPTLEYPIRREFVLEQIDLAEKDIETVLAAASDDDLARPRRFYGDREVKLGYILMRVMTHELYHMGQMAYMRSWLDDDWHFDGFWGKAASAIIAVPYATTEGAAPGF